MQLRLLLMSGTPSAYIEMLERLAETFGEGTVSFEQARGEGVFLIYRHPRTSFIDSDADVLDEFCQQNLIASWRNQKEEQAS